MIGIYYLYNGLELVYIGKSRCSISHRISIHKAEGIKKFNAVKYVYHKVEGLELKERAEIERYQPKYNKMYTSRYMDSIRANSSPVKVSRVNMIIGDALHKAIKMKAVEKGMSMKALLQYWIDNNK